MLAKLVFCDSMNWDSVSWDSVNDHLLTPDREPMTEHTTDGTKVQLGEPMVSFGSLMGIWAIYRSRNHYKTA